MPRLSVSCHSLETPESAFLPPTTSCLPVKCNNMRGGGRRARLSQTSSMDILKGLCISSSHHVSPKPRQNPQPNPTPLHSTQQFFFFFQNFPPFTFLPSHRSSRSTASGPFEKQNVFFPRLNPTQKLVWPGATLLFNSNTSDLLSFVISFHVHP